MSIITSKNGFSAAMLYRSLLKLAIHSASSAPTMNVKKVHALIRNEFERHKNESRPEVVESLKSNAVAALTHYLYYISTKGDKAQAAKEFKEADEELSRPSKETKKKAPRV